MPLSAIIAWLLSIFKSFSTFISKVFGSVANGARTVILGNQTPTGNGQAGTTSGGLADVISTILSLGTQATLLNEAGALRIIGGSSGVIQTIGDALQKYWPFLLAIGAFILLRRR